MVFWAFFMEDLIIWLGFDEVIAQIGYSYALVLFVSEIFELVAKGLHNLLKVCGYEDFSAMILITQSVIEFIIFLSVVLTSNPTLQTIGIIHLAVNMIFFVTALTCIHWKGWLANFGPGLLEPLHLVIPMH